MANRSAQAHLSTQQISQLRHDISHAYSVSRDAGNAEELRYARRFGLRIDTVAELARAGHKERTR